MVLVLCPSPLAISPNVMLIWIGSEKSAAEIAIAALIAAWMLAEFGSLVMELSNVGTMSNPAHAWEAARAAQQRTVRERNVILRTGRESIHHHENQTNI